MKTNFNIGKLRVNSTIAIKKTLEIKPSKIVDQAYDISIDFKKLPTSIYHFIRNVMDIEMEVLEANFISTGHLANNKINFIVADHNIKKTNTYNNIYYDFINSLMEDIENCFNKKITFNVGTKLLSLTSYFNLKTNPELVKFTNPEDKTLEKILEKHYLTFLDTLEKINFKPFISKKIVLSKNNEDLFNLTIDFLPNKAHINLKTCELLNGIDLDLFKLNIINIEEELNREYSKENCSYYTISTMAFEVKSSFEEEKERTIYGFLNAISNAIMIFFKADHNLFFIQNKNTDCVFISNDCKNKVQKDFLNRNNILIGFGEFSLLNFINISNEISCYTSSHLKNLVNYLLIEGKS